MDPVRMPFTARIAIALSAVLLCLPIAAQATSCTATSGERRVALLELYTSEGCSSCPPADRWVRELPGRGLTAERVVVLAFHVDYWDYIGWPDPYAQRQFSERQRHSNARNGARFVYTPQLMLDGKDYRRGFLRDDVAMTVAAINRQRPGARLGLTLVPGHAEVEARAEVAIMDPHARDAADIYLALVENRLGSAVTAGENRGQRLAHDFVVRELAGPFSAQHTPAPSHRFKLAPDWKISDLSVAVFAQMRKSGSILQALAQPYCGETQ
jgi:hypothetical protein